MSFSDKNRSLRILFISPQPIYPPDSGPKHLAYGLLGAIAAYHRCDVVGFAVDTSECLEWQSLEQALPGIRLVNVIMRPRGLRRLLRRLIYFVSGLPVSVASYEDNDGHLWLRDRASSYDLIHFDSFNLARYREDCGSTPTLLVPHDAYSMSAKRGIGASMSLDAKARYFWKWLVYSRFERCVYHRFSAVAPVSDIDAEWLMALDPRINAHCLGIPVDGRVFGLDVTAASCGSHHLLVCGSFANPAVASGMIEFLERVYPLVRRAVPDLRVTVWGQAPTKPLRRALGKYPDVNLSTFVDDYGAMLRSATVYVLPQRYGAGIQTKLQQSMAVGNAVVARKETLSPLKAEHGVHAFCCDDNTEMANTIIRLLNDERLRTSVGIQAAKLIEAQFSVSTIAERLNEIYSSIIIQDVSANQT